MKSHEHPDNSYFLTKIPVRTPPPPLLNPGSAPEGLPSQARSQGGGGAPGAYAPPQAQATPKKGLN